MQARRVEESRGERKASKKAVFLRNMIVILRKRRERKESTKGNTKRIQEDRKKGNLYTKIIGVRQETQTLG